MNAQHTTTATINKYKNRCLFIYTISLLTHMRTLHTQPPPPPPSSLPTSAALLHTFLGWHWLHMAGLAGLAGISTTCSAAVHSCNI